MQRSIGTCWIVTLFVWLVASVHVPVAGAQSSPRTAVRSAEEPTRLFATLDVPEETDGLVVSLPSRWTLEDVSLLRYGSTARDVRVRRDGASYVLASPSPIRGPHDLSLLVTPNGPGDALSWSIQPFRAAADDGSVQRVGSPWEQKIRMVRGGGERTDNRVLEFAPDASQPVVIDAHSIPAFERSVSFTTEFWISTIGLGEVVMSTWTGEERRHYPFEIVVDASGRLRFYCGQPGRHTSMSSGRPIADGRWHHVGIAYDGERRFLRFMINGVAVDSVEQVSLPGGYLRPDLAVGGRLSDGRRDAPHASLFSGQLDVLRIWDSARTPMDVRQTMRDAALHAAADDENRQQPTRVTLTFDRKPPARLVRRWPRGAQRPRAALRLRQSLHDLRASTEGEVVQLQWHADATTVSAFLVERSSDGINFEEVERLTPEMAEPVAEHGDALFTASDDPSSRVAYYRIREVFSDGSTDVSGTFKVGVGPATVETKEGTRIIGNYPNPFSRSTTVEFQLNEAAPVRMTLWDVSGKRLGVVYDGSDEAGTHSFELPARDLPSGTYFLRLETGRAVDSHPVVVLK
ncbi:hypothetical protein CRI94_06475 [Longibacter salinarum]|uniref:LamG-like jellyroll fold domain-containing protein n=1 Tax=Longibacter salinarum TaxID=1850348 RepID=A0A2A8CYJ0_9BACT|nr:LamG-like jellyroll fold domain-containing protein [Longibacter salinarum]PEN13716.1 hypothetical protein CRI94_06475 [Longibacter salinarum]